MASGLAEISLDKTDLRPDKKIRRREEPAVLVLDSNDGFVLAYSTHRFEGADGNPKYSYDKRNGFTIAWTAKGDVAPQKAASK